MSLELSSLVVELLVRGTVLLLAGWLATLLARASRLEPRSHPHRGRRRAGFADRPLLLVAGLSNGFRPRRRSGESKFQHRRDLIDCCGCRLPTITQPDLVTDRSRSRRSSCGPNLVSRLAPSPRSHSRQRRRRHRQRWSRSSAGAAFSKTVSRRQGLLRLRRCSSS